MPETSLIRVVTFQALHHYGRGDRSPEWNERRFGDQHQPHEHRFRVVVIVSGPPDPETGFVMDLVELDRFLEEIVGPLRGADLNQAIPEVRAGEMQPSTEELARWIRGRLGPRLPEPARLRRVEVWESDDLGAWIEG